MDYRAAQTSLGNALRARFAQAGDPADLGRAVGCHRAAVADLPEGAPDAAIWLAMYGHALHDRYAHEEDERDLAECAEVYARAAARATGGDQDHILSGQGTVSIERYRRGGDAAHLQAAQRAEFADIDQRLRRIPADGDYLPTKTGNILRAGERRPAEKYGLDAIVVWPRLWLLLPADTRSELSQARSALDSAVASLIWGLLFAGFTALAWWALPAAIAVALAIYLYWIPDRAAVFADLLESAFDIDRGLLYRSLRWPLPENPRDEHASGEEITSYLMRGLGGATPTFTSDTGDS